MRELSRIVPLMLLAALIAGAVHAAEPEKAAAEKEPVATVLRLAGSVNFKRAGGGQFQALRPETKLLRNDQVKTGPKSAVELKLADGALITLGAESSMVLRAVRTKGQPDATLLDLDGGLLGAAVEKPAGRQRFEISTPVAVCGVRGTRWAVRHLNPRGGRRGGRRGKSTVTVGRGLVNVKCLNPLMAGRPGVNVGKSQLLQVTWDGFGGAKPAPASRRRVKKLMGELPGWIPDPTDPGLLQPPLPPDNAGGLRRMGMRGPYRPNGSGFHGAAHRAILGRVGLTRGSPLGNAAGAGSDTSGGPAAAGAGGGSDPVKNVPVAPGQPTAPPPPPPQEPPMEVV